MCWMEAPSSFIVASMDDGLATNDATSNRSISDREYANCGVESISTAFNQLNFLSDFNSKPKCINYNKFRILRFVSIVLLADNRIELNIIIRRHEINWYCTLRFNSLFAIFQFKLNLSNKFAFIFHANPNGLKHHTDSQSSDYNWYSLLFPRKRKQQKTSHMNR